MNILIAHAIPRTMSTMAKELRNEGHTVRCLTSGTDAALVLRDQPCDLLVLSQELTGRRGADLIRDLRLRGDHCPAFLLGPVHLRAELEGLKSTTWLSDRIGQRDLVARILTMAKTTHPHRRRHLDVGALWVDMGGKSLWHGDATLDLPRRELDIFIALALAQGAVLSKGALLDALQIKNTRPSETLVEVYISRLRKRLARYGITIKAQRGAGYHLVCEG